MRRGQCRHTELSFLMPRSPIVPLRSTARASRQGCIGHESVEFQGLEYDRAISLELLDSD